MEREFRQDEKSLKKKYPNFDVFIDDNPNIIKEVREAFATQPEKVYVMPDYKCNRHVKGENVYHIKTTVSDLKDQDFAIAALEMKNKQLEQKLRERERERAFESNLLFI